MNVKRILHIASLIEKLTAKPKGKAKLKGIGIEFDMSDYGENECPTAACIAGWTAIDGRRKVHDWSDKNLSYAFDYAQDRLGLDRGQALRLFRAQDSHYEGRLQSITPRLAVAVLRNLAKTGEVDWNMRLS